MKYIVAGERHQENQFLWLQRRTGNEVLLKFMEALDIGNRIEKISVDT